MLSVRPHLQYESLNPATTHVIAFLLGGEFFWPPLRLGPCRRVDSPTFTFHRELCREATLAWQKPTSLPLLHATHHPPSPPSHLMRQVLGFPEKMSANGRSLEAETRTKYCSPPNTAQTHHNQQTDFNASTQSLFPSAIDVLTRQMDFNTT